MRYGDLAADTAGTDDSQPAVVLLHGLTFDRQQWAPVLADPAITGPGRRVVAFDLPGHGESPRRDSYRLTDLAEVLHAAVTGAGLVAPVVAGHSASGVLATAYGALYPVSGVVNIDQPLRAGGFAGFLRRAWPALNSEDYLTVWQALLDGMHVDALPPAARELVRTRSTPRQDLFLGYWKELVETPAEDADEDTARALAAIVAAGVPYLYIAGSAVDPGYRTWLEAALPGVQVTELPGSGHFPHLAQPTAVARALMCVAGPGPQRAGHPVAGGRGMAGTQVHLQDAQVQASPGSPS